MGVPGEVRGALFAVLSAIRRREANAIQLAVITLFQLSICIQIVSVSRVFNNTPCVPWRGHVAPFYKRSIGA